ncbi:hypothetical protein QVD17_26619 [Tagetes erecta]|uniref:Uncharacterized protein n=1 Tax=Tagetes erecta TaxID=13708 RepID=A0AAD8KD95_TARER|nr:hypothetical protein QVD17_26619 [Tagetes erecta]
MNSFSWLKHRGNLRDLMWHKWCSFSFSNFPLIFETNNKLNNYPPLDLYIFQFSSSLLNGLQLLVPRER